MSTVNIGRAIDNIRTNTTIYTPLVETIVNSIQAIDAAGSGKGQIEVAVIRAGQQELDGSWPEVQSFRITDNGIGFTESNRDSFDTLYSDLKLPIGGKGFGRFTCLKYFHELRVESDFYKSPADLKMFRRSFRMGKDKDIIIDESTTESKATHTGTRVTLEWLKDGRSFEKRLETIGRTLLEKLLPYFITEGTPCPRITLSEADGQGAIVLNDFVSNEISAAIKEMHVSDPQFVLKAPGVEETFRVRLFKIFSPKNQKSRISLIAHKREVDSTPLHEYVPEFAEEFCEQQPNGGPDSSRNYIVRAYVFGDFLDRHVALERGSFDLESGGDPVYGIKQRDIEKSAAQIASVALGSEITTRQDRKRERVTRYVEEAAPWHRHLLKEVDITTLPMSPSPEDMEISFQKEKFREELRLRTAVKEVLEKESLDESADDVAKLVESISDSSKNDLVHYIATRRNVLEIFAKSLQLDKHGKHRSEGVVHDIIFPRRSSSDDTPYHKHNLWLVDERLNFADYITSDIPIQGANSDRPDLAVYDRPIAFRGDNEASNPITIFEFKKPQRDDFTNESSKEDPVNQIIRYVNLIRDGKLKTPEDRNIRVADHTPFFGYVVCDINSKVEKWLEETKDFTVMPDRLGWFQWREKINLYIEVLSWDKVLRDAKMRNSVFFHHLKI